MVDPVSTLEQTIEMISTSQQKSFQEHLERNEKLNGSFGEGSLHLLTNPALAKKMY